MPGDSAVGGLSSRDASEGEERDSRKPTQSHESQTASSVSEREFEGDAHVVAQSWRLDVSGGDPNPLFCGTNFPFEGRMFERHRTGTAIFCCSITRTISSKELEELEGQTNEAGEAGWAGQAGRFFPPACPAPLSDQKRTPNVTRNSRGDVFQSD